MNTTQIVTQFYDARDGLKAITGDGYAAKMETPKRILREAMLKHKCSAVQAFIIICKQNDLDGWEKVIFMAAVCEVEEFLARCHAIIDEHNNNQKGPQ